MIGLLSILRAKLAAPEREVVKAASLGRAQQVMKQARQRGETTLARYETEGITLKALGAEMGISIERVRQIIVKARHRRAVAQKAGGTLAGASRATPRSPRATEAGPLPVASLPHRSPQ